ncbi:hypothetical protein HZA97_07510 [Candidatus Woesearchaeota archaeon]|nr:hypothetical protein [Candidatus Woesearchaeota archaeon]
MVKKKSKEMNKYLKLALILIVTFVVIAALYEWVDLDTESKIKRITGGEEITSSELALTLLTQEEAESAINLKGSTLPLLPQFYDKLNPEDVEKYHHSDLVARLFISKNSGDLLIDTALTLFDSEQKAKDFIMIRANESGAKTSYSFNGTVFTSYLTSNADENSPPSSTLRFAIKNLVAKIIVYGGNPTIDYTTPELLGALVKPLATEQKKKMEQLLRGELPGSLNLRETNMALNNLPYVLPGAELIGLVPITQQEWLGETQKLGTDTLQGFVSGAQANYKLPNLPKNVLSIVIMEFESKEDALREQQLFLKEGVQLEDKSSEELALPESLKSFSTARVSDTMSEVQAVNRVYLYDIAIFSPYDEFDKEKAKKEIIKYSQIVLG